MTPIGLRILRTMAGEPGRAWSCSAIVSTWRPERVAPVAIASALRALVASEHVSRLDRDRGYMLTSAGVAEGQRGQLALPPPALTFGSATAALALLGRAAGPAHAAEVDALQALLSAVAGALRAPSDAPLVEALLEALGRRP